MAKKSHTDVSDEADVQDNDKWIQVHANMGVATASIASVSVTEAAFSLYGMRFLFNLGMNSWGIAVSEGFPYVQEFHPLAEIVNFTKITPAILKMDAAALKTELEGVLSDLSAVNTRIHALSVEV